MLRENDINNILLIHVCTPPPFSIYILLYLIYWYFNFMLVASVSNLYSFVCKVMVND
jgi:hypothetical protein